MAGKVLEQLDFAQRSFGEDGFVEYICEFFDGNFLVGLSVSRCTASVGQT